MMNSAVCLVALILLGCSLAEQEGQLNILIVPIPFAGHLYPVSALGEQLVRNGHNVTICTPVVNNTNLQSKTAQRAGMNLWNAGNDVFDTEKIAELSRKTSNQSFLESVFNRDKSENDETKKLLQRLNLLLNNSNIQKFDMIIVDIWLSPLVACISKNFKVPFIVVSPGLLWHPSLLPTWPFPLLGTSLSMDLTLFQRILIYVYRPILSFFLSRILDTSIPELQCGADMNYLLEPFGHHVPLFITSVIGFEYPRDISSLTSYVGPLLTKNPEPIQFDLTNWLSQKPDNSVVYVSMGSVIYLTREMGEAILNGVLDTGMSLVWSLREQNRDILDGIVLNEKRVFLVKWAPQLSVFAHKATGAAVLHGGLGGLQEALANSIPVVVVPIANDHGDDAARVEFFNLGVSIQSNKLTAEKITESLKTVTTDASYGESIARLRGRYTFAGGVERAAELVEHYSIVGYDHLIPAYAKYEWSWIAYYNVDVKITLLFLVCVCMYALCRCCKCYCNYCFCERKKAKKD